MVPEPYWDFNMGMDFTFNKIKEKVDSALKTSQKEEDTKILVKGMKYDPEIFFHIPIQDYKFPQLVINAPNFAFEFLLCLTYTTQVTKYYDQLS